MAMCLLRTTATTGSRSFPTPPVARCTAGAAAGPGSGNSRDRGACGRQRGQPVCRGHRK
jgi:hypothetical protein